MHGKTNIALGISSLLTRSKSPTRDLLTVANPSSKRFFRGPTRSLLPIISCRNISPNRINLARLSFQGRCSNLGPSCSLWSAASTTGRGWSPDNVMAVPGSIRALIVRWGPNPHIDRTTATSPLSSSTLVPPPPLFASTASPPLHPPSPPSLLSVPSSTNRSFSSHLELLSPHLLSSLMPSIIPVNSAALTVMSFPTTQLSPTRPSSL